MKLLDNNFIPQLKQDVIWDGDDVSTGQSEGNSRTRTFEYNEEPREDHLDIPCNCGHCVMRLWRDEDNLSVAFYLYAPNSFWARLKKAWKLLFKGERALLDDVVIDQNGVNKLKEFLQ